MGQVIEAIYESGRLRPLDPLPLSDGDRVRVEVEVKSQDTQAKLDALDGLWKACSELTDEQWTTFDEATQRRSFFRSSGSS